jgi:tRNA(adenine34) deaminase
MCAGALHWTQMDRVVFGAREPKTGFSKHGPSLLHPKTLIQIGVMEEECTELMQQFFKERRN